MGGTMDFEHVFKNAIAGLKAEGRYRVFADLERQAGSFPRATRYVADSSGREVVEDVTVWCSNDYLAMGQHPAVLAAMHEAIDRCGAGADRKSTRLNSSH